MKKLLLTCMLALGIGTSAQTNVANYSFTKSTGATYTPITGGTKLFPTGTGTTYDNDVSAAIALSSPFTFGGVAVSSVYVSANGYITFGVAPAGTNYTPLSTLGSTTGAIAAFGQDGSSSSATGANSEVRYEDLGTEFVVQYQDHADYSNRTTEKLNFQIRLTYATGEINVVYGDSTDPGTSTSSYSPQVGIRGNSTTFASNVNNLVIGNVPAGTTCDWSKAVTANANSSTMLFSASSSGNVNVKIPNGLKYTWTPGTQLPVRTFAATTAVTNSGATLSWTAPTDATAYNVRYRALGSCDWTDFSGNPVSTNTASLTSLAQSTTYQVQVQALNGSVKAIYSHIPNLAGTGNGYVAAGSFTTLANCTSTVTGLSSSALTPDTATISWTASATPPGNGYEYYYSTSSTAPTSTTIPSGSTTAGIITANLSGLTPATQYYYWVRANCNGTDKGVWSSSANFTTLSLCATVTAPTANASGVSLIPTITWNAINGATGYRLNVGTTSGGTDVVNNVDLGNVTSYTFSSALNSSTSYYYSVTAYTATTAAPATPCTVRIFQTECTATNVPYTLDFDSVTTPALPICTSVINVGTGNAWKTVAAPTGTGFSGKVLSNSYHSSNAANTWFFTQGINLTAGVSYRIKYKYANSVGTSQYLEKLKVAYGASATAAGMTTVLATHDSTVGGPALPSGTVINSSNPSDGFYTLGIATPNFVDFIPAATGVYYFGFNAYSVKDMNQLYVDDINIDVTPTCFEPTAVTIDNSTITPNGATVSWTAPTSVPSNGYEVYYSTSNTAPTSSTVLDATNSTTSTTTSATITGLQPNTTYYVWVRSVCVGTDRSIWSTVANFTTPATCLQPTAVTIDNSTITSNGTTVSWTAPTTAPSNGYEVYYSISNTAPTSSTVLNAANSTTSATTSATISGLQPSTTYYVWVRSVCIGTDRSVWTSTAGSFTTLCQPPVLLSTSGAVVCPGSAATLSATADAGATINWYDVSTGGTSLATGNSFTTPAVTTTTTYYVSATTGSESSVGPVSPTAQGGTIGTQTTAWGVYYTTTSTAKLKSVDIFPITSGQTGSIKIVSGSQSVGTGTALATIPFTTNVSGGATAQTILIDVELPAGSYTLYPTLPSSGLSRNTTGANYPYTSSIAKITGNGYDPAYYMCFYNFIFSSGCESARQPVVATADSSACLGISETENAKNNIKVYPNPFSDVLNISDIKNVKSISVVDIAGRLVKSFDKPTTTLSLRELNSGMYLVVLNMNDGTKQTLKAIKK